MAFFGFGKKEKDKMKTGLEKTRTGFWGNILNTLTGSVIDDEMYDDLEEQLILADVGGEVAVHLVDKLRDRVRDKGLKTGEQAADALRDIIAEEMTPEAEMALDGKPAVILVIGVNGVGKTTSIAKLADYYTRQGKRVMLAAGDTFRAAASEQLEIWASRAGVPIVSAGEGADPAAVIFDTVKSATARGYDMVIADTAGRLHNKSNLMAELSKISRSVKKASPEASLETLLVLDATTGQNGLIQAKQFQECAGVTGMVLTKLLVVAALGVSMVGMWHLYNVGSLPPLGLLVKNAIITLPFTLTSILFIQTLSPMVISYRSREKSIEVARHKALRAMNIAFGILFVTVFFYAVSFTLAMGHDEAVKAYEQNISALAIAAQFISGDGAAWVKVVSVILNIFAVMTAFFGVYLGFREATQGIVMNILRRKMPAEKINENLVQRGIMIFAILLAWSAIVLNAPVLSFTSIRSPIFGMVGCLIPAWLVYKVPALHKYKGMSLYLIIVTGLLLCVSPFLAFS